MNWYDTVNSTLEKLSDLAKKYDDEDTEFEHYLAVQLYEKTKSHFDTLSLARIATALYKIANIEEGEY